LLFERDFIALLSLLPSTPARRKTRTLFSAGWSMMRSAFNTPWSKAVHKSVPLSTGVEDLIV